MNGYKRVIGRYLHWSAVVVLLAIAAFYVRYALGWVRLGLGLMAAATVIFIAATLALALEAGRR